MQYFVSKAKTAARATMLNSGSGRWPVFQALPAVCSCPCAIEKAKKFERIWYIFSGIKVLSWEKLKLSGLPYMYFMDYYCF